MYATQLGTSSASSNTTTMTAGVTMMEAMYTLALHYAIACCTPFKTRLNTSPIGCDTNVFTATTDALGCFLVKQVKASQQLSVEKKKNKRKSTLCLSSLKQQIRTRRWLSIICSIFPVPRASERFVEIVSILYSSPKKREKKKKSKFCALFISGAKYFLHVSNVYVLIT